MGNVRVMLGGAVLAQAITFAASPLLARLYEPAVFGVQYLFVSVASALVIVHTWKLDVALVMARDETEQADLIGVFAACVLGGLGLLVMALALFGEALVTALKSYNSGWICLTVPMVAAMALNQLAVAVFTVRKRFDLVSMANVAPALIFLLAAVFIWLMGPSADHSKALVFSRLSAQIVLALAAGALLWRMVRRVSWPTSAVVRRVWRRFRPFFIFNTPYSLIGTLGRDTLLYVLAVFSTAGVAGLYGLARVLLLAPTGVLSASLRQVFYREAVEHRGSPYIEQLAVSFVAMTALTMAPLFAFVAVCGEEAFALVFGETWRAAGLYAMILAPAAWMSTLTSWPDRLFEVSGRQDASFIIQISADVLCAATAIAPLMMGFSPSVAIACYAAANIGQHTAYLYGAFRVSRFDVRRLIVVLVKGVGVFALAAAVFWGVVSSVSMFSASEWVQVVLCAAMALAAAAFLGRSSLRIVATVQQSLLRTSV